MGLLAVPRPVSPPTLLPVEALPVHLFHALGVALAEGGTRRLADRLTRLLVEAIGCSYAEVGLVGEAEQRLALAGTERGEPHVRWRLLLGHESMYLRVDGPLAVTSRAETLMRAIEPWLRALAPTSPRVAVTARLDLLAARWRLSKKQGEILRELGLGLSNKEIAQRFDCSVKTVEAHVSEILRRSGAGGRGDLLQTLWSGEG